MNSSLLRTNPLFLSSLCPIHAKKSNPHRSHCAFQLPSCVYPVLCYNTTDPFKGSLYLRSHRLSVRTSGFHPEKRGSTPLGTTLKKTPAYAGVFVYHFLAIISPAKVSSIFFIFFPNTLSVLILPYALWHSAASCVA